MPQRAAETSTRSAALTSSTAAGILQLRSRRIDHRTTLCRVKDLEVPPSSKLYLICRDLSCKVPVFTPHISINRSPHHRLKDERFGDFPHSLSGVHLKSIYLSGRGFGLDGFASAVCKKGCLVSVAALTLTGLALKLKNPNAKKSPFLRYLARKCQAIMSGLLLLHDCN